MKGEEVRNLPVSIMALPITNIFFLRHSTTQNHKVAKDRCSLFPSLVMAILQNMTCCIKPSTRPKVSVFCFVLFSFVLFFSIMFSAQEIIAVRLRVAWCLSCCEHLIPEVSEQSEFGYCGIISHANEGLMNNQNLLPILVYFSAATL